MSDLLLPAEDIALTVARAQVERGENPTPNISAVLVMTLDRLKEEFPQCEHQHIIGFREVYRNGEFEGIDYDECEVSGMKANRQ